MAACDLNLRLCDHSLKSRRERRLISSFSLIILPVGDSKVKSVFNQIGVDDIENQPFSVFFAEFCYPLLPITTIKSFENKIAN